MTQQTAREFWDERYGESERIWSGRVNQVLGEVAPALTPGRALDLGSGEGGDAIWLAQHGWRVTGVEISPTAVARARLAAAELGVPEDLLHWVTADLADLQAWNEGSSYELVTASFLQSPLDLPRAEVLRQAAALVAPGGMLLVISRAAAPPWSSGQGHDHARLDFPTPSSELADLELEEGLWDVHVAEVRTRDAVGPDGQQAVLDDTVVLVGRHP